jgi:hypothetical protein
MFWTLKKTGEKYERDNKLPIPDGGVKNLATCISFD